MENTLSGLQRMLQTAGADIQRQLKVKSRDVTFPEVVAGFFHAIDWTEPLVLAICAWHCFTIALAVASRQHTWTHAALFTLLCIQVLVAEQLNVLGQAHWKDIATQNYFDSNGVFISVVMSLPTVIILLGMLIHMVKTAGDLLVEAKVAELKAKKRASGSSTEAAGETMLDADASAPKARSRRK